jgi:hypothetical protein
MYVYICIYEMVICERWIGTNAEESGRGLIWGAIPVFAWRDWGELRRNSVTVAGLQVGRELDRNIPNTNKSVNHSTTTFCFVHLLAVYMNWVF